MKQPAVYILASRRNGTLYAGVTSNLPQRIWQHRSGAVAGFTARYNCKILVWYELHATMADAIAREKQIKGGSRKKKLALIEAMNAAWRDLYEELMCRSSGAAIAAGRLCGSPRHCERSEAIQR